MKHGSVSICVVSLPFSSLFVLVWFLFIWLILWPKAMLGRKGFIWLICARCHGLTVDWRKPRRELNQGLWRSGVWWLPLPVWFTRPVHTTQEHMPKSCSTFTGLASFASVIKQEHVPTDLTAAQPYGGIFSDEVFSSSWLQLYIYFSDVNRLPLLDASSNFKSQSFTKDKGK